MHDTAEVHIVMSELMKLTRMHHAQVENKINKLGIHRSQHMTLMFISKNDGKVTQKDIARKYGISEAAVSVTIKKLESAGYIEKECDEKDARFNSLKLTDKGSKAVKESVDIFNSAEAKTFENITDEELKTLKDLILKMQRSISEKSEGETQ
ncbi:MAG: MarR family transcriptional regulator [Clostridia bacterium]|nr:MarR family transcriptional regulator [Clostridia bacterium]